MIAFAIAPEQLAHQMSEGHAARRSAPVMIGIVILAFGLPVSFTAAADSAVAPSWRRPDGPCQRFSRCR
ncbi:hypothetical protein [Actinoplanes sp. NPDC051411]|uniref:hypothetical protein n=1 Tax=Actinoplanes sp. NPDC051411 TaxID=3155522 RepID=UPI0034168D69